MRKIKFRAWDRVSEELVGVKTLDFERKKGAICAVDYSGVNGDLAGEWELEQFTGLVDKNGKEIYENDIVQIEYDREYDGKYDMETLSFLGNDYEIHTLLYGLVKIWGSKGIVMTKIVADDPEQFDSEHPIPQKMSLSKYCAVAGNAHENPELLEEELG